MNEEEYKKLIDELDSIWEVISALEKRLDKLDNNKDRRLTYIVNSKAKVKTPK